MKTWCKAALALVLILAMTVGGLAAPTPENQYEGVYNISERVLDYTVELNYSDFPTGWSEDYMVACVQEELIHGDAGTDLVRPQGYLTRAEMAAIMVRVFGGGPKADLSGYTDVSPSDWFYEELAQAVAMGLFTGDGNGHLNPNALITREQCILVLSRAFYLNNYDADLSVFPDADQISDWARDGIAGMYNTGRLNGRTDGLLYPLDDITREEFAKLLFFCVDAYITKPGVYIVDVPGNVVIRCEGVILIDSSIGGSVFVGDNVSPEAVTIENSTIGEETYYRIEDIDQSLLVQNQDTTTTLVGTETDQPVGGTVGEETVGLTPEPETEDSGETEETEQRSTPIYTPTVYYYDLTITIKDTGNHQVSDTSTNHYMVGSTPFYAEVVPMIWSHYTGDKSLISDESFHDQFNDPTAREIMHAGLDAYAGDLADWTSYLNEYVNSDTPAKNATGDGSRLTQLADRNVTVAALEGTWNLYFSTTAYSDRNPDTEHDSYTVTVTITKHT